MTSVSEPIAFIQTGSVNGADRNSSILSESNVVATATLRLALVVRTANEKTEATATRPHNKIPAVIRTSIKVNPRFVLKKLWRKRGGAVETLKRGHGGNQGLYVVGRIRCSI